LLERLRGLLMPAAAAPAAGPPTATGTGAGTGAPLRVIQASIGSTLHMIRVDDVLYFEAADKYVRVVTADREALIRTSLRELQPQLPADRFWQIHRSTLVHCEAIATAQRDEAGRLSISLRDRPERLAVSRFHSGLFKGM
jgi:DNA-binding LytR/AlgR family response regulator